MKSRFIVNCRSGRAARSLSAVREFARRRGAEVMFTERPRHARELAVAAVADGCELIVAVGGDGTMNEVASALIGTRAMLGLVPCGSGDGLGRHLRIHGPLARALAVLDSGTPRLIDTGIADGHPFFTVAGFGFEADIAQKFNQLERRGFFRYLTTSAAAFHRWQPQDCVVRHDGVTAKVRAFTLAVANANQYGNNARIAPRARIDDGLLDLCAVPPIHAFNAAPLLARLFTGTVDCARGVTTLRGPRFTIERPAPGPLHTDGEIHSAGAVIEFSIRPASLRVLAPIPSD